MPLILGYFNVILKMQFSSLFYWLVSSDLLIMPSDECYGILLMISQHWFQQWLGDFKLIKDITFLTHYKVNTGSQEIDIHGWYSLMNLKFAPNCLCRNKWGRWCHNANVLHSYGVLILTSNRPSLVAMVKWIINVCLHWVHVSSKHDIICKEQNAISLNYEVIDPPFSFMTVICL